MIDMDLMIITEEEQDIQAYRCMYVSSSWGFPFELFGHKDVIPFVPLPFFSAIFSFVFQVILAILE